MEGLTRFIAVVPGAPALLPELRGQIDTVPELRSACLDAVAWLAERSPSSVAVVVDSSTQHRAVNVAASLLAEAGYNGNVVSPGDLNVTDGLLLVVNGSARRGEKAPGHLDPRALDFDEQIERALAKGDPAGLSQIDVALGTALLAEGLGGLVALSSLAGAQVSSNMLYADDPYGVRYWVVTWECAF